MRRAPLAALFTAIVLATGAVTVAAAPATVASPAAPAIVAPQLHVATVVSGLDHPWDVSFAPDGAMFFTERPGRLWVRPPNSVPRVLNADMSDLWVASETGLMSVEVDPQFAANRRLYTCQ